MENKNGQGIFLGVVSVATLIVAIIGATFAFFSAQAETNYVNEIAGGTNDDLANALSARVERVAFTFSGTAPDVAPASDNLVPTNLAKNSELNLATGAITAKCVDGGYTGCHLYRIVANSKQTISEASLKLATFTATTTNQKDDWQYLILKSSVTTAETGSTVDTSKLSLVTGANGDAKTFAAVDMHGAQGMTANQDYEYYLLIFLNDSGVSQNSSNNDNATGTYSGTVTFTAAGGGQVTATFSA